MFTASRLMFGTVMPSLRMILLLPPIATYALVGHELAAQEIIGSEVSCPDCVLSVTRVARLGASSESLITPASNVCRGLNGRYYVAQLIVPSELSVYDAKGQFLRSLGESGSGPGEFSSISAVVCGIDEKLRVFDRGNGRITVLTEAGEYVTSESFPSGYVEGAVALRDGRIAVNTTIQSGESIGHPIHIVTADGRIERSLGRNASDTYRRNPVTDKRILAAAGIRRLWAAHMNRYQVDLWSVDGQLLRTIERAAAWFEPWEGIDVGEPFFSRPKPRILSMFQDSVGNLWTSSLIPGADWKPSSREDLQFGIHGPTVALLDPLWNTVIEVIDVRSGRLRYAARMEGLAFQFIGDGLAYRPRETPDGTHYLEVVRMRLTNR